MAKIGERASLRIVREKPSGLYLDGGELGEVLLPRREVPDLWEPGGMVDVFPEKEPLMPLTARPKKIMYFWIACRMCSTVPKLA